MKSLFTKLFVIGSFLCLPLLSSAQGGPGDPGEDPDTGTAIPFDGGLSLLVGAGVAYGIKKANDKRKKNKAVADEQREKS